MSKTALLCSVLLMVPLAAGTAAHAQAQRSAVPNFASADFGWQAIGGPGYFPFSPVEGNIAPVGRLPPALSGASEVREERLGDAENPNLTPWAAGEMRKHNQLVKSGHRAFYAQSRCWPGGVPGQLLFLQPVYFLQTPNEVWMIWERDHQVRRIYLNREHSRNPKPSWFGESTGHYESGELVIDTIGFIEHPYSFVDNYTTPHTKDLHVVERWKIGDDGKGAEAVITVEDPGAFKAPWSGMIHYRKVDGAIQEWACAENNRNWEQFYDLPEYPMPIANTPDF